MPAICLNVYPKSYLHLFIYRLWDKQINHFKSAKILIYEKIIFGEHQVQLKIFFLNYSQEKRCEKRHTKWIPCKSVPRENINIA